MKVLSRGGRIRYRHVDIHIFSSSEGIICQLKGIRQRGDSMVKRAIAYLEHSFDPH